MHRILPICTLAATLWLAACDDGSDFDRAVIGGIAGCVAGDIIDEGSCLKGAAVGAAAGALADDV